MGKGSGRRWQISREGWDKRWTGIDWAKGEDSTVIVRAEIKEETNKLKEEIREFLRSDPDIQETLRGGEASECNWRLKRLLTLLNTRRAEIEAKACDKGISRYFPIEGSCLDDLRSQVFDCMWFLLEEWAERS